MKRKKAIFIINILLCIIVLVSCGNSNKNQSNKSNEEAKTVSNEEIDNKEEIVQLEKAKPYITTTKESEYETTDLYIEDRIKKAQISEGISHEQAIEIAKVAKEAIVSFIKTDYRTDSLDTMKIFFNYASDSVISEFPDEKLESTLQSQIQNKEVTDIYDVVFDEIIKLDSNQIRVTFRPLKDIISSSDQNRVGNLYAITGIFTFNMENKIEGYYVDYYTEKQIKRDK